MHYLFLEKDVVALREKLDKLEEQKLGTAIPKRIKIIGEDVSNVNWHFKCADTFASRGQKLIYKHMPLWVEKALLQSPIVPWSYAASNFYHDVYWWNMFGRWRVRKFMGTDWGKLFYEYRFWFRPGFYQLSAFYTAKAYWLALQRLQQKGALLQYSPFSFGKTHQALFPYSHFQAKNKAKY